MLMISGVLASVLVDSSGDSEMATVEAVEATSSSGVRGAEIDAEV
jgi:hypothetical protein